IRLIKEWDFVRVIASLSIVLLHATTRIAKVNGHIENDFYQVFRILLTASTAVFILLSIIIISHIYKNRLPNDFIRKRIKYILLPFLFFAIVYAYYNGIIEGSGNFYQKLLDNFKGNYVGWFILPIFQLYLVFCFINLKLQVLFPLWLVYFGIAYFIGNYYKKFSQFLEKKYTFILIIVLFTLSILLVTFNFNNGNHSVNSRRIDLIPYVTMLSIL